MMSRVLPRLNRPPQVTSASIDAHATPLGEDDDGFVTGGYLISVGSLHRALGVIGHPAAPCRDCEGHDAHELRTAVHVLWSAMQRAMNHPEAWRDHLRPAMDRYRGTGDATYKARQKATDDR